MSGLQIRIVFDDEFVEVWTSGVADGCDFTARCDAVASVDVVDRIVFKRAGKESKR